MDFTDFFEQNAWRVALEQYIPSVAPAFVNVNSLQISSLAKNYLSEYKDGIYQHQARAIATSLRGQNICLTTATASGKSLVFYTTGIELLQRTNNGTILAIYPLKALTDEQEQKWLQAAGNTRANIRVGRIDGSVSKDKRKQIIKKASVTIMTPDVIHAWLLSNLTDNGIRNFLANLQLVVIDEAHTYSGVFGSNAAYLFRRIHHLARLLGATPRYIAASATISDPQEHMRKLTGLDFSIIGSNLDTSGRKARRLLMVEPPSEQNILSSMAQLMRYVVEETAHRFVTFVDSRKQTEQLAAVMGRLHNSIKEDENTNIDEFERMNIFPYRAGYEPEDRKRIENELRSGAIRGVISTSALELGIDLTGLTLGILYGLSNSGTTYFQRIGRVGRHEDGTIVVVNNGSVLSNRVFRNLNELDNMPLAESTLYLDNKYIQYIHAMCLARPGGEHEIVYGSGDEMSEFVPRISFPDAFVELCQNEQIGEIEPALQAMKGLAGNNPNSTFPLRDCEVQFSVSNGRDSNRLGTLSYGQVMREAYPGAVYYHMAVPYRVQQIRIRERKIFVRSERYYTTTPISLPTLIFPNFTTGNIYSMVKYGHLIVVESNLQVREWISGFKERRGPNEFTVSYPLNSSSEYIFDAQHFLRHYFSSGVSIIHSALDANNIERDLISALLFEAFLMQIPFERQDVNFGFDKIRADREPFRKGSRLLCVFDQTYGSLRLTSRLMNPEILRGTIDKALDIARHESRYTLNSDSLAVLENIHHELESEPRVQNIDHSEPMLNSENSVLVIMPGSIGLSLEHNNQEFKVEGVIYTPSGLRYRGRRSSQTSRDFEDIVITMPVNAIECIPDVSQRGYYEFNTGEIIPVDPARNNLNDDYEILTFES